ncbi:hypothetical protein AMJ80_01750 [bacterium SM23_31]|nr:MAG: hypothetical protein AMJ80_01750 [bacterium SM23_31]
MKKIWVTALEHDEKQVQVVLGTIRNYGMDCGGHFWTDDPKNMSWLEPKDTLVDKETALWVLTGSQKNLEKDSVRFGLALLALTVQAKKGYGFPILFVDTEGDVNSDGLPTPLKGVDLISIGSASLGAKMVAKVNTPVKKIDTEYRIDIHANRSFGLWFEVGPYLDKVWHGALLGVYGGGIDFHGVGEAGKLPQKAVLEYPMKGLKLQLGEREYEAWAVQNNLDENHSYYVRVKDMPGSIIFGPYTAEEEAEVNIIDLY